MQETPFGKQRRKNENDQDFSVQTKRLRDEQGRSSLKLTTTTAKKETSRISDDISSDTTIPITHSNPLAALEDETSDVHQAL